MGRLPLKFRVLANNIENVAERFTTNLLLFKKENESKIFKIMPGGQLEKPARDLQYGAEFEELRRRST